MDVLSKFLQRISFERKKNKSVDISVDGEEYEKLLEGLGETSKEKKVKKIKRVTDPRHLK